ncbi:serine/threonine-protein phosphatase 7 long form homolog [Triticum dicoccoides]|uniref:serine/threonine-protein phosphatase 7 long form homolog n=1 Tax=Triticum dicoccoides TaxID=85692 RepID=UPI001891E2A8|nr:serine/threonine-protein phosphatase 7 long form homolog [Triticum dicoccoides]
MAGERWYDGLHKGYDKDHRARDIENNGELTPMRMRGYSAHDWSCDERYEPYFERLGLLPFMLQFKRHAPSINHAAMTALIDRWRPETHSFHLSCGEMTVTLEDMAMISGLPINGEALTGNSWGSGALAYLYRQLDEACRRKKGTSGMGGFVWCLQVWMWERMPVGRPEKNKTPPEGWVAHDGRYGEHPWRFPTIAYCWEMANVYTGSSVARYKCYINELDMLTHKQVDWEPYDADYAFRLNEMCTRDRNIWRARCPLICFYAVEWHYPYRVARQFGRRQGTPRDESFETSQFLHRISRKNNPETSTWAIKHSEWISLWNQRVALVEKERRQHSDSVYEEHLKWLARRYRLKLKPGWNRSELEELDRESGYMDFNVQTRDNEGTQLDYAQLHDRVGMELLHCVNEAGVALGEDEGSGSSEKSLRKTMKSFVSRFHKMAAMLSCHGSKAVLTAGASTSRDNRRCLRLVLQQEQQEEQLQEEPEQEEAQQDEEEYNQDEEEVLGMSQMDDAPEPSQPTQRTPRSKRGRKK